MQGHVCDQADTHQLLEIDSLFGLSLNIPFKWLAKGG